MSRRRFFLKLALFLGPIAAIFALPIAVLVRSWELAPVSAIAAAHRRSSAHATYGPAYTNPVKGYKLASIRAREAPLVAIGTSRIMNVRADFFRGGEASFYNAGGIVARLYDHRILLRKLRGTSTRQLLVTIDMWAFNEASDEFAPDPGVEADYDGAISSLDVIQRALKIYPDLQRGKFALGQIFGARDAFGINAMTHGNGFLRDGSYLYADLLRDPASGDDFEFHDALGRVRTGTRHYEYADAPSAKGLAELERLADAWRAAGLEVAVFLPPYAPAVVAAMRARGGYGYVFDGAHAVEAVLTARGIPFADFTTCGAIACTDEDFLDGTHGGSALYAKMLLAFGERVPWLAARLDRESLDGRLARHRGGWELARE